jgi:hypothetical protein
MLHGPDKGTHMRTLAIEGVSTLPHHDDDGSDDP